MESFLRTTITAVSKPDPSDSINECATLDPAVRISDLITDPTALVTLADKQLRVFPFKDVKPCWRRLYADASIAKAVIEIQRHLGTRHDEGNEANGVEVGHRNGAGEDSLKDGADGKVWLDEVVRTLDMAVIMTGALGREEMVEELFEELQKLCESGSGIRKVESPAEDEPAERPAKRRRISPNHSKVHSPFNDGPGAALRECAPSICPSDADHAADLLPLNPVPSPHIHHPIPRIAQPTLSTFSAHLTASPTPSPIIITSALSHWPARTSPHRSWRRKSYLLSRTIGGRRLVPVEIGSSYTSTDWSQRILPFKEFLSTYITPDRGPDAEVGYLAQHHLLSQIPSLRPDISVPDYVYTDPPPPAPGTPVAESLAKNHQSKIDEPIINTWFGPAWTVSPLHHDPWHGLLCQVMGRKYVRLYAPEETGKLYPRGVEDGVDMSNTSGVNVERYEDEMRLERELGVQSDDEDDRNGRDEQQQNETHEAEKETPNQLKASDEDEGGQLHKFPLFCLAKYVDAVLEEGEMLYIPVGWWHYVRSLSTSWSVSFWWN